MPKVYNRRHHDVPKDAVYVGRPTIWGNPYSHLLQSAATYRTATREEAVARYREMLLKSPKLLEQVKRLLKGKDLVCWCVPAACHANILLEIANE